MQISAPAFFSFISTTVAIVKVHLLGKPAILFAQHALLDSLSPATFACPQGVQTHPRLGTTALAHHSCSFLI